METSNTALRAKNDAAAARELRDTRADTIEGLKYALADLEIGERVNPLRHQDGIDAVTIRAALDVIERRWPA